MQDVLLHLHGKISIHAPRAGSDSTARAPLHRRLHFNPRSPCGERRRQTGGVWRNIYFNPRSPCGERHAQFHDAALLLYFNPRSPCGERQATITAYYPIPKFQSTLPVRGATDWKQEAEQLKFISIHAPRAGSDGGEFADLLTLLLISIHAPRAGSDHSMQRTTGLSSISIHAPRAGSDRGWLEQVVRRLISIHAPRAGSDKKIDEYFRLCEDFNPRSPCGERRKAGGG